MRPLTLTELEARYNMTKEELQKVLAKHRDDIPAGCKAPKTQVFNIPFIEFLDNILNIHPVEEEDKATAQMQLLTSENEDLKKQVDKLKESYQSKENELVTSKKELREMEDKFLDFQNSATAGNKQVVEKLRNENDTLKSQVANFEKLKSEQMALKDSRIKDLETQIANMEETILSNASLTSEKMKFELRASNLDKQVVELNKKISSASGEKTALENEISKLKESKVLSENQVIALQGALSGFIKSVVSLAADAKLKLENAEHTITTIPDIKEEVHTIAPVEEEPLQIEEEEPKIIDTNIASAPSYEKPEIRQDEDETEGADASTPFPGSF